MARRGQGLTGRIRAAALELGKDGCEFGLSELSERLGVKEYAEHKRIHWMLRDLKRAGELIAVHRGRYRIPATRAKAPPQKQEVMWRVLRGRRTVTAEDLVEFAAASAAYAKQWLRMLLKRGVVRDLGAGKFQLVKDSIDSPADVEKAEKLREFRARKKEELLAALQDALQDAADNLVMAREGLLTATDAIKWAQQARKELDEFCT